MDDVILVAVVDDGGGAAAAAAAAAAPSAASSAAIAAAAAAASLAAHFHLVREVCRRFGYFRRKVITVVDCAGSWGAWGTCSKSCETGTQSRTYAITTAASNGGTSCAFSHGTVGSQNCNTAGCPVDCVGDWGVWGTCDVSCGGGSLSRTYEVATAVLNGGVSCAFADAETETLACSTADCPVDCVGDWDSWGACALSCAGGTQSRTYQVTTAASAGGVDCDFADAGTETKVCNTDACPVDCVGDWGSWGACDVTCGTGSVSRTYVVATAAAEGGVDCTSADADTETLACTPGDACPVDCVGRWALWDDCSVSCAGGTQARTFRVTTAAAEGGVECELGHGNTTSRACNTNVCGPTCYPDIVERFTCQHKRVPFPCTPGAYKKNHLVCYFP